MKKKNARDMALEVLYAVLEEGAYSNLALNRVLEKYQPEKIDRGFITELAYGTLRTLNTLDWVLNRFLKQPVAKLPAWIRNILRMGVYQIIYMDKVPDSAACNESANLARTYGHAGTVRLVNGVLRNVARSKDELEYPDIAKDPVRGISIRYAHPEWLVERWVREYGVSETEKLCRANNEIPPNAVRTNTLKISRAELQQALAGEGVDSRAGRLAPETLVIDGFKSVGALAAHRTGMFIVQDESSTLVGHAVHPQPGSLVIDACSAPGGKSTHIAQLMNNTGRIISCDVHSHKIKLIEENAARLGITIIEPVVLDAVELDRSCRDKAGYVLVDAPCSGLGVLRRRPEIRWRKQPGEIAELHKLQLQILCSAGRCVQDGGILVYSTCTITHEENADVINEFLQQCPEFQLDSLVGHLPDVLREMPGTETMIKGYLQFLPHIHGTDGFFIARFRKSEGR